MDISSYFTPVTIERTGNRKNESMKTVGESAVVFENEKEFPELAGMRLALVGVCSEVEEAEGTHGKAADEIRRFLYRLAVPNEDFSMVDLGNIIPGHTREETLFAVQEVLFKLIDANMTVVIIGGSEDLAFANYKAYEVLGRVVNIASIDSVFDLGNSIEPLSSCNWISHIVAQQPNYLFNFSNIGYQSYFTGERFVRLMDELDFDAYRLGAIQSDMRRAETIVRGADMVSVDIGSVRLSDAPGQEEGSPHGFYGEELCRMARFAGASDKLTSIGFYEYDPRYDLRGQTAHLIAHAIWYFFEGFNCRSADFPFRDKQHYKHYMVELNGGETSISFYKSMKSDRWWMEVPYEGERKGEIGRHLLIPCTYDDYKEAQNNAIPELWMKYYNRIN